MVVPVVKVSSARTVRLFNSNATDGPKSNSARWSETKGRRINLEWNKGTRTRGRVCGAVRRREKQTGICISLAGAFFQFLPSSLPDYYLINGYYGIFDSLPSVRLRFSAAPAGALGDGGGEAGDGPRQVGGAQWRCEFLIFALLNGKRGHEQQSIWMSKCKRKTESWRQTFEEHKNSSIVILQ